MLNDGNYAINHVRQHHPHRYFDNRLGYRHVVTGPVRHKDHFCRWQSHIMASTTTRRPDSDSMKNEPVVCTPVPVKVSAPVLVMRSTAQNKVLRPLWQVQIHEAKFELLFVNACCH